jgi:hypothetical protein
VAQQSHSRYVAQQRDFATPTLFASRYDFRCWHEPDQPTLSDDVRCSRQTGSGWQRVKTALLTQCMVRPCVASGFAELAVSGLASGLWREAAISRGDPREPRAGQGSACTTGACGAGLPGAGSTSLQLRDHVACGAGRWTDPAERRRKTNTSAWRGWQPGDLGPPDASIVG